MKNSITPLWLCSLSLLCLAQFAPAQDLDFAVIAQAEDPALDGLSFDVLGQDDKPELPIQGLDFAVLDCSKCDCETTGVCLCDDCDCDNCPLKPLITVKTMPKCPPCKRLKRDSKSEALSGFRFVFIEQEEVSKGAPRLEWEGIDSWYGISGWQGSEWFKRVYHDTQKAKPLPAAQPMARVQTMVYRPMRMQLPVYRPMFQSTFAPRPMQSCVGGACRTCR